MKTMKPLRRPSLRKKENKTNSHWDPQVVASMILAVLHTSDRINEGNERLRVIEKDIENIQKYIGVLARKL
jgi:hypothetical protein